MNSHRPILVALAATSPFLLILLYKRLSRSSSSPSPQTSNLSLQPPSSLLKSGARPSLPYPPDALPGARDVASPYGTLRVYEWGPVTGRKVLLVHGISTPCITLASVASGLVEKGARVCLFGEDQPLI